MASFHLTRPNAFIDFSQHDMYRRSIAAFSKQAGRTIVRDPRKLKTNKRLPVAQSAPTDHNVPAPLSEPTTRSPMPFEPSQHNQQSIGSSLGSYMLAGVGVTMGVILVRVVLGV
jgi:hypothetical protein